jgi:hypothetical protein
MKHRDERRRYANSLAWALILPFHALPVMPTSAAAAEPARLTESELVAAVHSHKTLDGAPVGEVVDDAARSIQSVRWWADRDKQEAGYSYADAAAPQSRHFVIWEVGADGVVTPLSEEAWVAELGRMPFAYFINQRNIDAGDKQHVDRRLIDNPRALAFLTTADGNLAQIFVQRHLALRRMTIQWIADPSAKATDGRLYYGYLVTIDLACRGAQGEVVAQRVQFIEPRGNGGFERADAKEQKIIPTLGTKCLP